MLIRSNFAKYSVSAHDVVLRRWHEAYAKEDAGALELDLSSVEFFDPYGICGLVLFLNHLPPEARPITLKLLDWPDETPSKLYAGAVAYLTRMNFWEAVKPTLCAPESHIPTRPAKLSDRNVLLEVTVLHTHEAISGVLRKTGELLQNLSYTISARGHILEVLSELCSNVLMHAQTDFGAVAAMQTYRDHEGRRYIVIGIGDAGIGVRASLAANSSLQARLESDAQALNIAVQPGASRFAVGGHGGGLPRVLEIARRYGGRVAFRSGTGALVYHGTKDGAQEQRRVFDAPHLQGTQLRISIPEAKMKDKTP